MLHNRFAGDALKKVDRLYEAGITINGQIVLCKGINDGEELLYNEMVVKWFKTKKIETNNLHRIGCSFIY